MTTLLNLAAAALLALATSGPAAAAAAQQPAPRVDLDLLFPTPAAPLICSAPDSSLADLLDALSEATGVPYLVADPKVAAALREPRALMPSTSEIAAADAYFEVESQLARRHFFLTCNPHVTPLTVGVHHHQLSSRSAPLLMKATRDDLNSLRRHPAMQFVITLQLEHLDPGTLVSRLKPLLPRTGQGLGIMPIGFSRTVALTSGGVELAAAVDLLRKLDAEAGASKRSIASGSVPSVLELAFPAPNGSLFVPAGVSPLADLVSSLSQATGVTYVIDASVKEAFDVAQVSLRESITLQSAEAYPWIESQMLEHGFGLSCDASSRPATARVRSDTSSAATAEDCLAVGLGDFDFVRRHPALGFTINLKFENVDARVFPLTLRALLPANPRTGDLTTSSDMSSISLRGHGRFVAQTADLMRHFDTEAGRSVTAPGPDGRRLEAQSMSGR